MRETVVFIAPSAYPLGGVQTWLDYIVPGVEKQGYDASIALTSGDLHDVDLYLKVHPFKKIHAIKNPTGASIGRIRALERLLTELAPDVVIVVNIADVYHAVNNIRRTSPAFKTKVITSIHGIHPGLIHDIHQYRDVIDAVITTNKLTQMLVRNKTAIEDPRVLYAPYGVPAVPASYSKSTSPSTFTIAYVGRLDEDQKRIDDVIDIFTKIISKIKNVKLLIAGDGSKRPDLEHWIAAQNNPSNIKYYGTLDPTALSEKVYAQSDAMLLTSHWETGPIVAWEAFSHGLVLVTSRYIGCAEENSLIDGKNCLMFDIGDTDSAVAKLQQATDIELRSKLLENAQTLISTKYSLDSSIKAWSEQIACVLHERPKTYRALSNLKLDSGRLSTLINKIFGSYGLRYLDKIKNMLNLRFRHTDAGGEWPHSHSNVDSQSAALATYVEENRNRHDS